MKVDPSLNLSLSLSLSDSVIHLEADLDVKVSPEKDLGTGSQTRRQNLRTVVIYRSSASRCLARDCVCISCANYLGSRRSKRGKTQKNKITPRLV